MNILDIQRLGSESEDDSVISSSDDDSVFRTRDRSCSVTQLLETVKSLHSANVAKR